MVLHCTLRGLRFGIAPDIGRGRVNRAGGCVAMPEKCADCTIPAESGDSSFRQGPNPARAVIPAEAGIQPGAETRVADKTKAPLRGFSGSKGLKPQEPRSPGMTAQQHKLEQGAHP